MTQGSIAHDYELDAIGSPEPSLPTITIMVASLVDVPAIAGGRDEAGAPSPLTCDSLGKMVTENDGSLLQNSAGCVTACFHLAQDAVRCAIQIQSSADQGNFRNTSSCPVLVRIGLHTGQAPMGRQNPERELASVARYCDSIAHGGEIVFTAQTRDSLNDSAGVHSLFLRTVALRERPHHMFTLYSAIWKPTEVEVALYPLQDAGGEGEGTLLSAGRRVALGLLLVLVCYLVIKTPEILNRLGSEKDRMIHQRVDLPAGQGR